MQVGPVSPLNPIYAEETEKRKHPEGVVNRSAGQGGEYLYVFFCFTILSFVLNIVLVSPIYAEEARKRRPSRRFVNQQMGQEDNVFFWGMFVG